MPRIAVCFALCASILLPPLGHAAVPASIADKISPETWRKVDAGELDDLLVFFDTAEVDAEVGIRMANGQAEKAAAQELRVERYRQIKERAAQALKADEADLLRDYRHIALRHMRFRSSGRLSVKCR